MSYALAARGVEHEGSGLGHGYDIRCPGADRETKARFEPEACTSDSSSQILTDH